MNGGDKSKNGCGTEGAVCIVLGLAEGIDGRAEADTLVKGRHVLFERIDHDRDAADFAGHTSATSHCMHQHSRSDALAFHGLGYQAMTLVLLNGFDDHGRLFTSRA